jgi:3-deoxy-D-manno-octulosonic acid kinase
LRRGSRWSHPGFEVVEQGGIRVLTRPEAASWVRFVLDSGKSLHAAASDDRNGFRLEGRSPVFVIPAKTPSTKVNGFRQNGLHGEWAIRHFVRGGRVVSALLGDRYLRAGAIRPYHEVGASEEARKRGIPTPKVIAAATYASGLFYRADLVTEFISEASDLVEALFDTRRKGVGGAVERLDALRAAGDMIRQLAQAGIRHRDLHAGNILLQWKGAAPQAHLLDLDRCEIGPEGKPIPTTPMHKRLERSLRKWERRTGLRVSEREWETLDRAVAG